MRQPPWWEPTWTSLRMVVALVIAAALTVQFVTTIELAVQAHRNVADTSANFFSYFTVLSNLGAAIALLWTGLWWLSIGRRGAGDEPRPLAATLACVTTYMLVTGVVYNVLLRGVPQPAGSVVPWSNEVLHVAAPVFLLLDLLLGPRRRALAWRAVAGILVFPLAWVVYTLVRGPLTPAPATGVPPWYPYPFLHPDAASGGYLGVAVYVVGIAVLIAAFGAVVVAAGRWRARRVAGAEKALGAAQ